MCLDQKSELFHNILLHFQLLLHSNVVVSIFANLEGAEYCHGEM